MENINGTHVYMNIHEINNVFVNKMTIFKRKLQFSLLFPKHRSLVLVESVGASLKILRVLLNV